MPHDSSGTLFFDAENHSKIRTGSPPRGATNANGVVYVKVIHRLQAFFLYWQARREVRLP